MTEDQSLLLMSEVHKLNPSSIVELYELDTTVIGGDVVLYFHNGTSGVQYDAIYFKGKAYEPQPIIMRGFEQSIDGKPPRPQMAITNIGGWMSALMLATKDMVGATITRRRTFAKFLDGMPDAAPIEFPPDVFTIEQKTKENRVLVEFELGCGYDLDGINFPGRQVTSGICGWSYRGSGCSFAGQFCVTNNSNVQQPGMSNYSDTWDSTKQYAVNESVGFTDSLGVFSVYKAKQIALGASQSPTNASYWDRVQRYRGAYDSTKTDYTYGDVVYVTRFGQQQFYYCSWNNPVSPSVPVAAAPPNTLYWQSDVCAKTQQACKYRFDPKSSGKAIPFGGFPGTLNLPEVL
jgi:lambda family phage minor tail protein L